MTNIVAIPDQEKRFNEASDWIVKFDRGLTSQEEREFQSWVCADKKNQNVFMSMAELWDDMDELSRLSDLFPEEVEQNDMTKSWQSMSIAASLMIGLFGATWFGVTGFFSIKVAKTYETSVGEHSTVNLVDGSRLILNTNTLVKVDYDDAHRLVTLIRGEVNINVAHDELRPLSVKAGKRVVQAVGTAFNIELRDDDKFELIVTEGKVRVGDRAIFESRLQERINNDVNIPDLVRLPIEAIAISKGQKILIGETAQVTKIAESDIEVSLSWREGNLIFDGQTLEEAIAEISRYTSVDFVFEDNELRTVRVAGQFKAGDINGLLSALDETFSIDSERTDKESVRLFKKL